MPAFTNVSFNRSPFTNNPKGPIKGKLARVFKTKMDMDFINHADRDGSINLWQRWDTDSIVDQSDQWEMTMWLDKKSHETEGVMDVTPRRCQQFKPKQGERFSWNADAQSGEISVDKHGLVTIPAVRLSKKKLRIRINKK